MFTEPHSRPMQLFWTFSRPPMHCRFLKQTSKGHSLTRFLKTTLSMVWANRFVASTREAGSMSAGTMTTPTTMKMLVPSMVHTTSSSFMVQWPSVHSSTTPERWNLTSAIPSGAWCKFMLRPITWRFISSQAKAKRTSLSSSGKWLAEAIFRRSGHSDMVRAAGAIRLKKIFAR